MDIIIEREGENYFVLKIISQTKVLIGGQVSIAFEAGFYIPGYENDNEKEKGDEDEEKKKDQVNLDSFFLID